MPEYFPPPSTLPPGSTVWGYLRDSGGPAQELSVSQQKDELERFCGRYSLVLLRVFTDVSRTGTTDVGRDVFRDVVDLTEDKDIRPNGLLLWNYARFARNELDATFYKATLRKRGLIIHSLTEYIPEGPSGRIVETVIDWSSEEHARKISRDTKRGLASIVRQGYSSGGTPPRGYIAEKHVISQHRDGSNRVVSKWVPDPATADLVKLAFQLRAEGHSYSEIQNATHRRLYRSINCYPTFFSNITYLGLGKCGELEIQDHHEALVDFETWEKVRKIQAESKRPTKNSLVHPRRISNPSLLSGIASCLECGSAMYKDKSRGWDCYLCGRKRRQGWNSCKSRMVNANLADSAVIDAVLNQVLTPDFLGSLLGEIRVLISDTETLDCEIAIARRTLVEANHAIEALFDMIELTGASRSAAERLHKRETERDQLQVQLAHLEAKRQAADFDITPEVIELALAAWRGEIENYQKTKDVRSLKTFVARFVQKVELSYNYAKIHYTYPINTLPITRKAAMLVGDTLS